MKIPRRTWRDRAKSALTTIAFGAGLILLAAMVMYVSILILPVLIWHM
ncbi:hypothetical protein RAJCM14343_4763 [Rhodococcus aetherivorans]|uniref:Uncharacterized protein n=1 Tax=Rhodococcus aetherivorans TaxID=191292 RepID=A0ABQ0YSB2_9NOCA|nr:hypothetical protein [Rhodococcus aetherivorans]ETT24269.1 hypothetical protein RR21198_4865 [Rhodococcus rhodochrous ATCC 21198]MDV6295223.1 hypothetical protein [Rhodococcus aetherivorans]NGP28022.1 hypothetical protein [Rhodococcus aetherivorans]GES39490.1 hypothetical protein RAJCM14343_4763 [Rhodococcus aetherivorans]